MPNVPSLGGDNLNLEWYLEDIATAYGRPVNPKTRTARGGAAKLTARQTRPVGNQLRRLPRRRLDDDAV